MELISTKSLGSGYAFKTFGSLDEGANLTVLLDTDQKARTTFCKVSHDCVQYPTI